MEKNKKISKEPKGKKEVKKSEVINYPKPTDYENEVIEESENEDPEVKVLSKLIKEEKLPTLKTVPLKDIYQKMFEQNKPETNIEIKLRNGETLNVGKNFVCAQVEIFNVMLNSKMQETKECEIDMTNYDPVIVRVIFKYLYTRDTSYNVLNIQQKFELLSLLDMYHLSEYHQKTLEKLKKLADEDKYIFDMIVISAQYKLTGSNLYNRCINRIVNALRDTSNLLKCYDDKLPGGADGRPNAHTRYRCCTHYLDQSTRDDNLTDPHDTMKHNNVKLCIAYLSEAKTMEEIDKITDNCDKSFCCRHRDMKDINEGIYDKFIALPENIRTTILKQLF